MLNEPYLFSKQHQFTTVFAIKKIQNDRNQRHLALLYRETGGADWLLHFGWHNKLNHERWNQHYHWVPFRNLNSEVLDGLQDIASILAKKPANQKIPYSVIYEPRQYFDHSWDYISQKDGHGLTCATFLLAVFRRWGLQLIDEESWPEGRPDDANWIVKILCRLYTWSVEKKIKIPKEHFIVQLIKHKLLRRYRPEEVCACADLFSGKPLSFEQITPVAERIVQQLAC